VGDGGLKANKISRRHHYTPRYYLKRFENDSGTLWRKDQESGDIKLGNNAHFGYKKHWNTLRNPPKGYAPDWAEKRLGEVDTFASATIQRILNGEFPKDIRPLAYAISFMKNNQPQLKRELESSHPDQVRDWSDDHWLIARFNAAFDDALNYVPTHYFVKTIEDPESDSWFLTSSNPLIEFDNKLSKLMPLSKRHCLFLSYDPSFAQSEPMFVGCDGNTVAEINRLTRQNSWQYVYSCVPEF
jgi:hypothetical protein